MVAIVDSILIRQKVNGGNSAYKAKDQKKCFPSPNTNVAVSCDVYATCGRSGHPWTALQVCSAQDQGPPQAVAERISDHTSLRMTSTSLSQHHRLSKLRWTSYAPHGFHDGGVFSPWAHSLALAHCGSAFQLSHILALHPTRT
jgi:hypothetical protein